MGGIFKASTWILNSRCPFSCAAWQLTEPSGKGYVPTDSVLFGFYVKNIDSRPFSK